MPPGCSTDEASFFEGGMEIFMCGMVFTAHLPFYECWGFPYYCRTGGAEVTWACHGVVRE